MDPFRKNKSIALAGWSGNHRRTFVPPDARLVHLGKHLRCPAASAGLRLVPRHTGR